MEMKTGPELKEQTQKHAPKQLMEKDGLKSKKNEAKRAEFEKQMRFEKIVLIGAFVLGLVATLLFIISFVTEYWVEVDLKTPEEKEDYERGLGKYKKTGHHHGLWSYCRHEVWDGQNETIYCRKMTFDVPPNVKPERLEEETKMADFRRSTVAVGIIALVMSTLAHAFTWYSLNQLRYMFKRLAGCLHLITGASCWVVSEVFRQSMMLEESSMKAHVKEFLSIGLGWSYYLVWAALICFLLPGCLLLYFSRKRKGSQALSIEEAGENEPVNLGRL